MRSSGSSPGRTRSRCWSVSNAQAGAGPAGPGVRLLRHLSCHFGPIPANRGMILSRSLSIALLALALASCVAVPPPPAPAPSPPKPVPPLPVTAPPRPSNWEDWRATPGDWAYRQDARGTVALFGPPGANAVFVIRCDQAAARVYLSRGGSFPVGQSGQMSIRTSSTVRTLSAGNSSESPPYVASELVASDRLLDAMVHSRGKFLVSVRGADDLIVPTWAEFARVVEDCRAGG